MLGMFTSLTLFCIAKNVTQCHAHVSLFRLHIDASKARCHKSIKCSEPGQLGQLKEFRVKPCQKSEGVSRKQFWILRCSKIRNRRHRLARKWKCPILCALRRKMKKRNEKRRVRRNRFRSNVATTMPPCSHLDLRGGGGTGGSKQTARERDAKIINAFSELLQQFASEEQPPNLLTSKGKGKKGKGKSTQARRMLRLPLTLRTLLQVLQETLWRFQKNKKGNLIANITRVITAAQNGKLDQDEGENTLPKLSNRDQQTRGKGKGQGKPPKKVSSVQTNQIPQQTQHKPVQKTEKDPDNTWVQVVRGKKKTQQAELKNSAQLGRREPSFLTLSYGNASTTVLASWVRTAEFAEQCRSLAEIHGLKAKFVLITTQEMAEAKQQHFAITATPHSHQLRRLYFKPLATELPDLPPDPIASSTHRPTETQLFVFESAFPDPLCPGTGGSLYSTLQQAPKEAVAALVSNSQ